MRREILVVFAFIFASCNSSKGQLLMGEYDKAHGHEKKHRIYSSTYILLFKDSTFRYVERYELPIEMTEGRWRIIDNHLILNSIPDTAHIPEGYFRPGTYIMFKDKSFTIKSNMLYQDDSSKGKFRIRK